MPQTTNSEHIQVNYNSNSWADMRKPGHALKLVDVDRPKTDFKYINNSM
jgi:hypothetical protein